MTMMNNQQLKQYCEAIIAQHEAYAIPVEQMPADNQALFLMAKTTLVALTAPVVQVVPDEEIYALAEKHEAVIVCSGEGDSNENTEAIVKFGRALLSRAATIAAAPAIQSETLYTCPGCGEQSYEDMGYGALRCCDCGKNFTKTTGTVQTQEAK